ncbi:glycoside hydrolase family 43 protein [Athelia psychrophila]|uniref:Glycoside hydrolase family 43 protein n=1 Tax=Athelia psychrophila TaxID=1759441 RepID=A0A166TWG5_9AGAM|nr:glycoside hydrolase family 43 protein [Fibularhizoctonia sp. CBS 109695]
MRSYPLFLLCIVGLLSLLCHAFENLIKTVDGSDPFMSYQDGYYYLTTTTWTNIQISRGETIQDLIEATPKIIYTDTTASRCCNVWAPEIHWKSVEGACVRRYYVAGSASTQNDQRIYALKSFATDIWASTWSFAGQIVIPNNDDWAIDPTVLITSAGEYLVYSSFVGSLQCLWIAEFITAVTVGDAYEISCPAYSWEDVGADVEEGPGDYSPIHLSVSHITQHQTSNHMNSPGGDEIWLVYHYSTTSAVVCDGTRRTAVQPITFSSGEPVFGTPDALTTELVEPV